MFTKTAELYDLLMSSFKDYPAEAAQVARLVRGVNPSARRVLDVGCGTGEHARLLAEEHGFQVDALDLDPAFVRIAAGKLPGGRVHQGDMMSFVLPDRYDVILCLFSSIGYVLTLDNVQRTLTNFRDHLAENGVIMVEPWFQPGVLDPSLIFLRSAESPEVTISRMSRVEVDGRLSRLQFEYLIGRSTEIQRASEFHELGLFTHDEMMDSFLGAGLEASYDAGGPCGRGLYVARHAG